MAERPHATTAEVCAAAAISTATAHRWSKAGLLPPYETIHQGRRGQFARWPAHAVAQAAWVAEKLKERHTFPEILAMLAAGEFENSRRSGAGTPPAGGAADEGGR
jgi:hypothetical protein